MGLKITNFFDTPSYESKETRVIVCEECLAHLCLLNLVLSDKFWGLLGDAYLVDKLINVLRDPENLETSMETGVYIINKIKCLQCLTKLGWYYKKSYNYSQYFKEGKFVIEKKFIRQIANHSSTAILTENARLLRRRRSSASVSSITDDDLISSFRSKLGLPAKVIPLDGDRRLRGHIRSRYLGIDKNELDEHEEDTHMLFDS